MKPFGNLKVEWDARKATSNLRKHGVSFEEAKSVLDDPLSQFVPDHDHSVGEHRFCAVGRSAGGRTLLIICADRGENTRILTARPATAWERKIYERG
jgi:uncharacterized DUF497 family protein